MEWQLDKIDNFIQTHLEEDFSLADVSNAVGYSPYHLSREFKGLTGRTLMNYVREKKITAAAKRIATGENILETALAFGFDTHSGFTRAFLEVLGCSPQEYYQYNLKMKQKGECIMDLSTLKVRLVCKDDRDSLWENVYSAMTPRQIMEDKIQPSIENYKNQKGFLAVAEVDEKAVMSMWVERVYSSPGFIYDSHYEWQDSESDAIFVKLLEGVKKFAGQLHMTVLCLQEETDSPFIKSFTKCGFQKVFDACGNDYYMISL